MTRESQIDTVWPKTVTELWRCSFLAFTPFLKLGLVLECAVPYVHIATLQTFCHAVESHASVPDYDDVLEYPQCSRHALPWPLRRFVFFFLDRATHHTLYYTLVYKREGEREKKEKREREKQTEKT